MVCKQNVTDFLSFLDAQISLDQEKVRAAMAILDRLSKAWDNVILSGDVELLLASIGGKKLVEAFWTFKEGDPKHDALFKRTFAAAAKTRGGETAFLEKFRAAGKEVRFNPDNVLIVFGGGGPDGFMTFGSGGGGTATFSILAKESEAKKR
jgi:hypothetical protein